VRWDRREASLEVCQRLDQEAQERCRVGASVLAKPRSIDAKLLCTREQSIHADGFEARALWRRRHQLLGGARVGKSGRALAGSELCSQWNGSRHLDERAALAEWRALRHRQAKVGMCTKGIVRRAFKVGRASKLELIIVA